MTSVSNDKDFTFDFFSQWGSVKQLRSFQFNDDSTLFTISGLTNFGYVRMWKLYSGHLITNLGSEEEGKKEVLKAKKC